jgi:addiction module HigA family antidote
MPEHSNVHRGELLREECLKPMGITAYRLAKDTGLARQRANAIVAARRGISPATDLRFSAYFGLTPGHWLRVQLAYDLREAMHTHGARVRSEVYPLRAA